jgi:hypothetical protein
VFIVGFMRTLQVDFTTLLGTLITIGILTGLSLYVSKQLDPEDEVLRDSIIKKVALVLSALALAIFFAHATLLGFSDRMDRSDVDKNPVYDQMNSH